MRTTELIPLILIPVLVVAIIALWFGARQVVQPLQSLEQKTTSLGWGDIVADLRRLTANVELALYRIAQEALSNVARHAGAARADVYLHFDENEIRLTIQDDGKGFVVPETPAEMAPNGHFGLLGVQERAEAIGAHLQIASELEQGTRIQVFLSLKEAVL